MGVRMCSSQKWHLDLRSICGMNMRTRETRGWIAAPVSWRHRNLESRFARNQSYSSLVDYIPTLSAVPLHKLPSAAANRSHPPRCSLAQTAFCRRQPFPSSTLFPCTNCLLPSPTARRERPTRRSLASSTRRMSRSSKA